MKSMITPATQPVEASPRMTTEYVRLMVLRLDRLERLQRKYGLDLNNLGRRLLDRAIAETKANLEEARRAG